MPETTIPEPAEKVAPTRGPWTVNGEGGIVGRVHYGACAIYITAPTTSYLDPAVTAEKAMADAQLMAAAPALLSALKDYMANGGPEPSRKSCGHAFYCVCSEEAARNAINAAEARL